MISHYYIDSLKELLTPLLPKHIGVFIFGSSAHADTFADVDIALVGSLDTRLLREIKETLHESRFPFTCDIIDFNNTSSEFQQIVLTSPIIWIISPKKSRTIQKHSKALNLP